MHLYIIHVHIHTYSIYANIFLKLQYYDTIMKHTMHTWCDDSILKVAMYDTGEWSITSTHLCHFLFVLPFPFLLLLVLFSLSLLLLSVQLLQQHYNQITSVCICFCIYYTCYLAAMTYNQVHYFRVNHLADFTQNGHTKIPVG